MTNADSAQSYASASNNKRPGTQTAQQISWATFTREQLSDRYAATTTTPDATGLQNKDSKVLKQLAIVSTLHYELPEGIIYGEVRTLLNIKEPPH